jgi:phage terminase small subunit
MTEGEEPAKSVYHALKRRNQRFVDEFIDCGCGAEAFRRIWPKRKRPDSAAWKLLHLNPEIAAAIEERKAEAIEKAGRSAQEVLRVIGETMDRCSQAVPVFDKTGMPVMVETADGKVAPAYVFDAKNVLKAAELLGSYHKLFVSKHEFTGKDGESLAPPVINIGFANGGPGG